MYPAQFATIRQSSALFCPPRDPGVVQEMAACVRNWVKKPSVCYGVTDPKRSSFDLNQLFWGIRNTHFIQHEIQENTEMIEVYSQCFVDFLSSSVTKQSFINGFMRFQFLVIITEVLAPLLMIHPFTTSPLISRALPVDNSTLRCWEKLSFLKQFCLSSTLMTLHSRFREVIYYVCLIYVATWTFFWREFHSSHKLR